MHGLFKCDFELNENPVQFWATALSFNQNTLTILYIYHFCQNALS